MSEGNTSSDPRRRRRAGLTLAGFAAVALVALIALVAFLLGRGGGDSTAPGGTPPGSGTAAPAAQPPPATAGGWDVAAETALATRPMLQLPESAALPHELTTDTAGPPLRLPKSGVTAGRVVPGGFPATPEGAVAQLAALTEVGLAGGDPQGYAQAYDSVALPGAPPANTVGLYTDLEQIRARASLPITGAVLGLVFTYKTTDGLIKGTTDGGRYAVVCVLGELTAGLNGQSISSGASDCQALRFADGDWRIAPGAPAAVASLAWPGTAEAVRAGYRAVS